MRWRSKIGLIKKSLLKRIIQMLLALALISISLFPVTANASVSLLSINMPPGGGGYGISGSYWVAQQFTAGSSSTITSIQIPFVLNPTGAFLQIFSDNSGTPGTVLQTWNSSSYTGSTAPYYDTFTGSFNTTASTSYWVAIEMQSSYSSRVYPNSTTSTSSSYGWSVASVRPHYYLSGTWAADNSLNSVSMLISGNNTTPLATPSAPSLSNSGNGQISVSESVSNANASSYLINVYLSDGSTFVESATATTAGITGPNILSGLTPNSTYGFSVTAIGDGVTYSNSPASSLSYITLALGTTTISLSLSGSSYQFQHSGATSIIATTTNIAGFVTFYYSTKGVLNKVFHCVNLAVSAGSVSCSWKPNFHGGGYLSAAFSPTSSLYTSSTSGNFAVYVSARTVTQGI